MNEKDYYKGTLIKTEEAFEEVGFNWRPVVYCCAQMEGNIPQKFFNFTVFYQHTHYIAFATGELKSSVILIHKETQTIITEKGEL